MKGQSLLTLNDVSNVELLRLLDLSSELKKKKSSGAEGNLLNGKNIALVFEKSSTRTRCAAAVAVADEGGTTEYLSSGDMHLGSKESVADTARVLGRMFDGIMFRGYKQETVETLAQYSGVPVWNGLTDKSHPTQILADLLTIRENFGQLKGLKVVYVGDGRNNVAMSLMLGCSKAGVDFIDCTPKELLPDPDLVEKAVAIAQENNSSVSVEHDPHQAVTGANVVYTDAWVSMGEESKHAERVSLLSPYQINMGLMNETGMLKNDEVIFLHCLPAFHDNNTELTKDSGALEVTDDVFEAPFSKVFDEAENRMHTIKAMIVEAICQQS
jgi:ornithine carbamoyltransferase